jgi:hypothetical protein
MSNRNAAAALDPQSARVASLRRNNPLDQAGRLRGRIAVSVPREN